MTESPTTPLPITPPPATPPPLRALPELLAPAGKPDVLVAVLAAGADAVYLGGKPFNMRRHRADFNFDDRALAEAVTATHALGRRLYVTVNILVGAGEVEDLKRYLFALADLGPDALIVQDWAVVALCRRHALPLPLHASTMLNAGSVEAARVLRDQGFTRLVTSRDITLDDARRMRAEAGIEVECFAHGDLCSVQSGQCAASGLLFGKSSNRGQCLKPCRWVYDLVSERTGQTLAAGARLLAARDLCLLQHIPELAQAGVDSLKIEGRMKPAEVMGRIVAQYRAALDRYAAEPLAPAKRQTETSAMHQARLRDLTTGFTFHVPGPDYFDPSGDRELIMLSTFGAAPPAPPGDGGLPAPSVPSATPPEIVCVAGTTATAEAALDAGAAHILVSWEGDLRSESGWTLAELRALRERCAARGAGFVLGMPRILTARELADWRRAWPHLPGPDAVAVTHPAAFAPDVLPAAMPRWLEPALNLLNPLAAAWLATPPFGPVARLAPAPEAAHADIVALAGAPGLPPLDLPVHGPLVGMVIEHCLPALVTQRIAKRDFCQMPCALDDYRLVDTRGHARALRCDRYCRNHLLLERELGLLPALGAFRTAGIVSWRVDARLDTPARAAALVDLYRRAAAVPAAPPPALVAEFHRLCPPATFTWGAYARGIVADEARSVARIKRDEQATEKTAGDEQATEARA